MTHPTSAQSTPSAASDIPANRTYSAFSEADRVHIDSPDQLIPIESVQKILNRSRASVYRYANTHQTILNPPFDPQCLNPEIRNDKDAPLLFHPNEVARFAQNVLGIKQVTIEVTQPAETDTNRLLQAILTELQTIKKLIK